MQDWIDKMTRLLKLGAHFNMTWPLLNLEQILKKSSVTNFCNPYVKSWPFDGGRLCPFQYQMTMDS
uniref:Uncharacterized protein n=1 Tax=Rhizophora mucronata TaxID=61149 RepID=A0A2P2PDN1_RHIMU